MPPLNVVVIDQNWAKIAAYRHLSTEFPGSEVACFTDPRPALDDRKGRAPDVILLDGDTTRVDLIAFARRFKERNASRAPAIMVLGSDMRLAGRARANGIDVYMQKPISTELFLDLMHQVVNLRASRARLAASSHAAGRL